MADEQSRAERWVSLAAGIVAPVTLSTALLFYFGYVSARSQYEYFGIDVDTIGLSTQDYVMRSPQPLLVPLLVLTVRPDKLSARDRTGACPVLGFLRRRERAASEAAFPTIV
jgi:hypothetical protein